MDALSRPAPSRACVHGGGFGSGDDSRSGGGSPVAPAAPAAPPRFTGPAPPARIGNFRELAQVVFERYETGEPIGITRPQGFAQPTYLVVLSGTERRPGQTTWIPENLWSAFNASDKYRDNILAAMREHGIP